MVACRVANVPYSATRRRNRFPGGVDRPTDSTRRLPSEAPARLRGQTESAPGESPAATMGTCRGGGGAGSRPSSAGGEGLQNCIGIPAHGARHHNTPAGNSAGGGLAPQR